MGIPRIYQADPLHSGSELVLSREAIAHLIRVLRLPLGATFRVFNGEGGEYQAKIISLEKNKVIAKVGECIRQDNESALTIHLGQGVSRGEKMDYTIQKAVELGVTKITPLITERCNVKLSTERWEKRLQHWRAIVIAACEQCGRNKLPTIAAPTSLGSWLKLQVGCKLLLNPHASQKLSDLNLAVTEISLLIGSEGGLDPAEISLAQQQGFVNLRLGPRILRTETAAVAAIAVLQNRFGDLN